MSDRQSASPLAVLDDMMSGESVIDPAVLRDQLSAVAGSSDSRNMALAILRDCFADAMADARTLFANGLRDGLETARLISGIHDQIILALWDYATTHEIRASNPTESERLALCGVGGSGRGEMAPYSDVDLLFLTNDKKGSPHVERLTEFVLYMLWDLGFKVGHSVRTIDQCLRLNKEDQTILTAMLDIRYLAGDQLLFEKLSERLTRDIKRGSARTYIAGKLEERDQRHAREGNSRYVIEPNVKEGKGGLRDLHVLYWIARFLDPDNRIADPQRASHYVGLGLFDEAAAQRFRRAADFLWRTRINLHWMTGRAAETLSFDRQVELCRKMGYASGPIEVAVERFMREYFTNAKEVGALTRIACAKLEERRTLKIPTLYDLLPGSRSDLRNPELIIKTGRLAFRDPMQIKKDPSLILQLFETAGRRNLDIHPDALSDIDFRRNLIDADFRRSPENAALFTRLLHSAKAPAATLRIMNEAGVLGRYLPEFGGIVARTQFNMHHAYTVDEHTLRLVDEADNAVDGRYADTLPTVNDVATSLTKSERLILMLACLLHDTGKGQGDQCVEGAQLSRRACRRLGQPREVVDTVAWLVRSHLAMSETAQRRDISDPETIREFAELTGSPARLRLLYILTVCDIRSVGPGVWNDWKGTLLRDLYKITSRYLEGNQDLDRPARAVSLREQVVERLPIEWAQRIEPTLERLGVSYWLNFDMADLLRHARFFEGLLAEEADDGVYVRINKPIDATELWVFSRDRPGLFADLTRAITSCGASVAGARLNTGPKNAEGEAIVMNVFYLHNSDGHAFAEEREAGRQLLKSRAMQALNGNVDGFTIAEPNHSRRVEAIPVKSKVRFSESAQGDLTIIEVQGRDRPGLLWAVAETLREHDISIHSAHIEGVGTQVIDAFYVRRLGSEGELTQGHRKDLREALKRALAGPLERAA